MRNELQNRKLIRPQLRNDKSRDTNSRSSRKKQVPPERTNAENFYYLKQMNNKTPMNVVLVDGEVLDGNIEWYDKLCIKVNREKEPNLLVMKSSIKYMYKKNMEDEDKNQKTPDKRKQKKLD